MVRSSSGDHPVQRGKAEHFRAKERLRVRTIDRAAEVLADRRDVANDSPGILAGSTGVKLGLVTVDRIKLPLPEPGDVDAERRREIDTQMRAEVINDSPAIPGLAGDGGFGQLAVEAGVFPNSGDGNVIRMGVVRIR